MEIADALGAQLTTLWIFLRSYANSGTVGVVLSISLAIFVIVNVLLKLYPDSMHFIYGSFVSGEFCINNEAQNNDGPAVNDGPQSNAQPPIAGEQQATIERTNETISNAEVVDPPPPSTEPTLGQPSDVGVASSLTSIENSNELSAIQKSPLRISDPDICHKILIGKTYVLDGSLGDNKLSQEESRAIPNQRLTRAFEIDNGFTTTDRSYGRAFRVKAEKYFDPFRGPSKTEGWETVAGAAQYLVSEYAKRLDPACPHSLEEMIQIISLKLVLKIFFEIDIHQLKDGTVLALAQLINRLWIQSKSSTRSDDAGIKESKLYFEELGIPWTGGRDNPFNILLPAYETLWRVVTRCIIEVVFRPSASEEWLDDLKEFLESPDDMTLFKQGPGEGRVPVKFLVDEALRLYPPTRRIYRQFDMPSQEGSVLVAADIESSHRLPDIWGDDSNKYRPDRWTKLKGIAPKAFMPFGGAPWKCPASVYFAPPIIGILVAVVATTISATDWNLQLGTQMDGSASVLDDEMELSSDRMGSTEWYLLRK